MNTLRARVGARFSLRSPQATAAVFIIRPDPGGSELLSERWQTAPQLPYHDYTDGHGNRCRRLTLPPGRLELEYEALVDARAEPDETDWDASEYPAAGLPDDALVYALPSRYCPSDLMFARAQELFGNVPPGWGRVQAICDWVHSHVEFGYGTSTPATTALDVLDAGRGVCRDFAHLAVAFCRALNIPARYAFGYLPDIDVPPPFAPMDFCAWFEAYLGGRWWIFDPRNNRRRRGRVTIARGRDALDVAMLTTFGTSELEAMTVVADEADADVRALV
ncbi:MAG: transglutaminase family protein [Candidatus Eremiobacteraeota bacterium]|nr:transglutaminase family protein [Candidatus Eremiobacteraeota bacterium]